VTVEQALVSLLAGVAGLFLFLGLAQALDDRPPRARRRTRLREAEDQALPLPSGLPEPAPIVAPSPVALPASASARKGMAGLEDLRGDSTAVPLAALRERLAPAMGSESPDAAAREVEAAGSPAPARSSVDPDLAFVETAMSLCLAGKHEELLRGLDAHLTENGDSPSASPSHVMTALWSLAGLARHGIGDVAATRSAFESGLRSLPKGGSEGCPPRLAALSVSVVRRLLELVERPTDQAPDDARVEERMGAARLAAFWLEWRLHAAPGDQDALALLDSARDALAEGHAELAGAMIRRHEYAGARALVQRAAEAGELSSARGDLLLELLGATFRREIDRLTAAAIRGGKDEGRAVTGLWRAEALLGAMPEGTIGPTHRAAVTQRIWRGHSKLGFRRLRLGQLDAAADTLFHALAMPEIGRRRQRQVRDALVRTLEGLGDQRAAAVVALVAEGKHPAAAEEIARLEFRVRRAREEGVSDEELEVASSKLDQLRRRLDEPTTAR
jgi:hypothetical protein